MIFHHVDAFADQPFAGNPAGVFLLEKEADAGFMHALAAELSLPMTAFVRRLATGSFDLRWFSSEGEHTLCGHATLASAHVLFGGGAVAPQDEISFSTRSGRLGARRLADGWIELDFPVEPMIPEERPGLAEALGVAALSICRNRLHLLVEVAEESTVRELRPDLQELARLTPPARGVIVTARAAEDGRKGGCDFVSRYFAPAAGLDEDFVTGSAHCGLAPFWGEKLGKNEMLAYQASARGGWLRLRLEGSRVRLAGQAVSVLRGEWAQGGSDDRDGAQAI